MQIELFFLLIAILLIGFRYYAKYNKTWLYYYERKLRNKPLNKEQLSILQTYFGFYRKLPARSKKIFEHRLALFIQMKKFIPRRIEMITEAMRVLIGAAAIQLTFGLPLVYLKHFKYIIVYPDAYYSTITKKFHKGEVNPRHQAIVLSWKSFLEGYIQPEGVNLGLHELAHALHLENLIRNDEYHFFDHKALHKWDRLAENEIKQIKSGENSFFRLYGSTDSYEFFAVAVENFFERPTLFSEQRPDLYNALSQLLKQNPLLLQK